jgi:hypothetical protein
LDVTNVYYYLKGHERQKRLPKETKSLATICGELLNVSLSKVSLDDIHCLQTGNFCSAKVPSSYESNVFSILYLCSAA